MIFVTVGTHEQQFDRLVDKVDDLKHEDKIKEDVFIQTGFSKYKPFYCEYKKMLSSKEMDKMYKDARIIITHGGPASFIAALKENKIPIVVPRRADLGEHVNNHQLEFCRKVAEVQKSIILVEDVEDLEKIIENYDKIVEKMNNGNFSNNKKFCMELEKIIEELF